jgi:hypothetical protein
MEPTVGALFVPAALLLGAPSSLGPYAQGLFCETAELVESVVMLADRGDDPRQTVNDINKTLGRRACIYSTAMDIRAQTVRYERNVSANHSTYSIYQVQVTTLGHQRTEAGDIDWKLSQPLTMYTLREARPEYLREQ